MTTHRTRPIRRGALALAAAAVLATTAACGGDTAAQTPDGWTHVEEGWLAVDVPSEWVETGEQSERWTSSWQDVEGDEASVQLVTSPEFGLWGALTGRGNILASAQVGGFPSFSVEDQSDPVETDALEVTRTDFTYEGADGPVEGVLWVAAEPDSKRTVALQLTGADLADDVVEQIQTSIRVLPEGGESA